MGEDEKDALDALESEAKEWEKDAEIERILNAFRLDAYASLLPSNRRLYSPFPSALSHSKLTTKTATQSST